MTAMVFQPRNVALMTVWLIYDSESFYGSRNTAFNMIFPQTYKEKSLDAPPPL